MTFSASPANATRFGLQFRDADYSDHPLADPRRSGQEVLFGVRQLRTFGRPDRSVAVEVLVGDRNAGRPFDRTLYAGEIEAALPFASRWRLELAGSFSREEFDDPSSNLLNPKGPAREDSTWRGSATLTFRLTQRLEILARGTYAERDSSSELAGVVPDDAIPSLDYRRHTVSLGVAWGR